MSEQPDADLVCLSHLRWEFVFQRPQHLMSRQARRRRVYFVEEPRHEPDASPRLDVIQDPSGVRVAVPVLPEGLPPSEVGSQQRTLLDGLLEAEGVSKPVLWYYTPMALPFTEHLDPSLVVYDCMDELSAFRGAPPTLVEEEERLLRRSDVVFTGGWTLFEAKRSRHPNVHGMPSSVDVAHFSRARRRAVEPADQAAIPCPRLGFFGVVDERMDLELLRDVAASRPEWQLIMIGPVVKIDPADLPRPANIHWLGGRTYAQLPDYVGGWDVALLPFARNESTRFISPTKTPEYLAAGRPVVSTSIRDVVRPYGEQGLVRIADSAPEFVAAVEALLRQGEGERRAWLARVDETLARMSWDETGARMDALMADALRRRRANEERGR
jgi:glycosyltransferase involved in cell wall biosynthesis